MGLPLFVAQVESDLKSKAAAKNSATSPLPAGVGGRRNLRNWSRDHRSNVMRRLNRDRALNGEASDPSGEPDDAALTPDYQSAMRHLPANMQRQYRELVRDMGNLQRSLDQGSVDWDTFEDRRTLYEERLAIMTSGTFGSGPQFDAPGRLDNLFVGRRHRRARFTDPPPMNSEESRIIDLIQPERQPTGPDSDWAIRRRNGGIYQIEATGRAARRGPTPSAMIERMSTRVDLNGLGDRQRSPTPEAWDTLLTTLTPDPQPPSVGSSFAASTRGLSSNNSAITTAAVGDPACEEGQENSGNEAPVQSRSFSRRRRRRIARREAQEDDDHFGADEDTIFAPRSPGAQSPWLDSITEPIARRRPNDPPTADDSNPTTNPTARSGRRPFSSTAILSDAYPIPRLTQQPSGWVGQMTVGASDDEPAGPLRLTQESSAVSGNATSQGEDDWQGMQRIVRSLARREDIPDEWWAEAGLSRTLP